jgi:hypothetical protein
LDPGPAAAARAGTGIDSDDELMHAALASLAPPDDFGAWLVCCAGHLPREFDAGADALRHEFHKTERFRGGRAACRSARSFTTINRSLLFLLFQKKALP